MWTLLQKRVSLKSLHLKVVQPSRDGGIERTGVFQLAIPTPVGPLHVSLDDSNLMAAVVPGVAVWKAHGKDEERMALDQGLLIKAGTKVVLMTNAEAEEKGKRGPGKSLFRTGTSEILVSKMRDGHIESVVTFDWH